METLGEVGSVLLITVLVLGVIVGVPAALAAVLAAFAGASFWPAFWLLLVWESITAILNLAFRYK